MFKVSLTLNLKYNPKPNLSPNLNQTLSQPKPKPKTLTTHTCFLNIIWATYPRTMKGNFQVLEISTLMAL